MSFWDLSDGGNAKDTGKDFEVPSGDITPIPDGSSVMAMVEEAKWSTKDDARFIELKWGVVAPEAYKNRKVFHKLWVGDLEPQTLVRGEDKAKAKRDKARRMLAAIDANAGGKLQQVDGVPSDDQLALHLCNKPMVITVKTWEIENRENGNMMSGNWVCAVSGKDKELHISDAAPAKPKPKDDWGSTPAGSAFDDEIPFAPGWQI